MTAPICCMCSSSRRGTHRPAGRGDRWQIARIIGPGHAWLSGWWPSSHATTYQTVSGAAMCLVCLKTICVGLFYNGYKYICVFVCLLGVLDMNIKRWRLDILFRLLLNFFLIYGFFTSVHEKLSFSFLFKYKLAGIDSYMCHSIVW